MTAFDIYRKDCEGDLKRVGMLETRGGVIRKLLIDEHLMEATPPRFVSYNGWLHTVSIQFLCNTLGQNEVRAIITNMYEILATARIE